MLRMRTTRLPAVLLAAACATATTAVAVGAGATFGAPSAHAADPGGQAFAIGDPRITESSGLAASRQHPGVYWTHNDSDDGPYVYAIDSQGRTVATVTLRGVEPRDVEAISLGPDGRLYVGDLGDNLGGKWPEVWIYAFAEPAELHDQTVEVTRYKVRYEDGPRDAEALMVHPVTGRAYIASKKQGGGGLYQGPEKLSPTGVNTFRRIADAPWTTDGAFSPDGTRLVLRGYFSATLYRWKDGAPSEPGPLSTPFQRQGSRSPSPRTAGRCSTGPRARTARSGARRSTTSSSRTPSNPCGAPPRPRRPPRTPRTRRRRRPVRPPRRRAPRGGRPGEHR